MEALPVSFVFTGQITVYVKQRFTNRGLYDIIAVILVYMVLGWNAIYLVKRIFSG
jgi:hypothetical protein